VYHALGRNNIITVRKHTQARRKNGFSLCATLTQGPLGLAPLADRKVTVAGANRNSHLGVGLTGRSKKMTTSVGSLPTSETGSGRFSRVAELGALLPASLVSRHFVVET
jgi:hypothetical protein